ncbi:MAG: lysylphosphatidylglycerol synthase transmembrane domain-containing protein [Gemmatimonadota bacterium]
MKWRHWIGVAISVVCLWWALRGVSWSAVRASLATARPGYLAAAAVGAVLIGVLVRAWRWRLFFPSSHGIPNGELVRATGIGLMANNVLPARMGEFVRAYVLGRRTRIPVTTAFGSLFVERLFDGAALALILIGGIALSEVPAWMETLAWVAGSLFLALLVFEVLLLRFPGAFFRLLHATTARFLPSRWEAQLEGALQRFLEGFALLRDPRRVALACVFTFVLWGSNGMLYYLGLLAFDLGRIGVDGAMIVQSVASLGVSIPSSPGFVGTFQAAVVKALSAFQVDRDLAFSYSIAFHAVQYFPVTLFGLVLLWRADLSWRELERSEEEVEEELAETAEPVA